MKTRLTKLKHLFLLCGTLATTAAFGQATWVWTNSAVADLGSASSWTNAATGANGVPASTANGAGVQGDTMLFDGASTGPVSAISTLNVGNLTGSSVGGAIAGIWLHITGNQTSPVRLYTTIANSASAGIRFNSINIDAGSGGLILGTGATTNSFDTLWGTANPSGQGLTNNSANPAIINSDMRWRLGAGGAHTMIFSGTGDWYVTNDIANVNTSASLVQKDGSGTMYWTAGHNSWWGTITTISTPMTISGGTLVLKSGALFPATTTINNNGTALVLDAPASSQAAGAQTIANPVHGTGNLQVNNGTLTLSGQNDYTGNTLLNGGSIVANRAENLGVNGPLGNGGFISFTGGTLVFSSVNAYDYSPRFTNSASQAFSFDTAGQNVTFTNAIVSTGGTLTKLGSGSLTLTGANTYDGATTVSAGKLVIQGSQGNGAITVANSAALGVNQGGQAITPASLTVGTSSSATLEFNNVSSTSTAAIAATGAVAAAGPITVNINSGSFLIGQSYPLFSWGSGSAPAVTLGTVVGGIGNLSTNGNTIKLNITGLSYVWTGITDGNWDTSTPNDWKVNGVSQIWANGSAALFDDTATGQTNVTLNAPISAASVTVNNTTKPYSITSGGANIIGGSGGLTKNGNSTLTLSGGVNTYTGPTTISGGTVIVSALANGGSASDLGQAGSAAANLVLNGGTLQYTGGGGAVDHLFTLGTAGGTIDDEGGGGLMLNNSGSIVMNGTGARTLTLTGNSLDELDAKLSDNGGATALTKGGAGNWIVTANNNISGAVNITGGTLQVGNGGATGSVGSGSVAINPASSVLAYLTSGTVTNGTVSGTGSVTVDGGGTAVMPGNNNFSGGTTVNFGSTLRVGNGGATGALAPNGNITVEGTLDFNTTGTFAYSGTGIAGGGNVIVRGGGKITSLGANSYGGWTVIGPGSTFQPCQGNSGGLASSVVTNNGTLLLIRQDNGVFIYTGPITGSGSVLVDANNFNPGDVTLTGNCDYTGGKFIGDNGLVVGDGSGSGWITNNVTFMNSTQVPNDNARTLTFNRPDDVTFPGNIVTNFTSPQSNLGIVVQNGTGTLTLTGTNTYGSGTVISNGVVQVGNGGTRGTIGSGPVSDYGVLVFNRSDSVTFTNAISGTGSVVQFGSGTTTLNGLVLTYLGGTTISNGTLITVGSSVAGDMNVVGGTLIEGGVGQVGTLNVAGSLNINSGKIVATLNKSLSPSNTMYVVTGAINSTGGTLVLTNVGPNLAVGDTFTIFNQPVTGTALTLQSSGFTVHDNGDGTFTVNSVTIVTPPTITATVTGGVLNLSWPSGTTQHLQAQTNAVNVGLSTNWVNVGGVSGNSYSTTPNKANGAVFYRLAP